MVVILYFIQQVQQQLNAISFWKAHTVCRQVLNNTSAIQIMILIISNKSGFYSSVTHPKAAEATVLMYLCIVPRVYLSGGATHFSFLLFISFSSTSTVILCVSASIVIDDCHKFAGDVSITNGALMNFTSNGKAILPSGSNFSVSSSSGALLTAGSSIHISNSVEC